MRRLLLIALLLLPQAATAHDHVVGDLHIIHPSIPLPPTRAMSAAGYVTIANDGATPDRLIAVETSAAKQTMIHTTEHGADGVARMTHLPAVDLPAGDTVVLEPGGIHVMFMGLTAPLAQGAMVPATLVFEKAGRVEVEFMVDPPGTAGSHDHTGH